MERLKIIDISILLTLVVCTTTATARTNDESQLTFLQQKLAQQTPVELVFLIDRSSEPVLREMPRLIKLAEDLVKEYPGAKFGINYFADFICSDWSGKYSKICNQQLANGESIQEACYTFYKKLSKDISSLKRAVRPGAIKYYYSDGYYESGLAALMMTATDKKVGWTGRSKKIIVVITDDGTHNWPKRHVHPNPPKGDGTDTCQSMQNPTAKFTGEILKKQDISLFLLLAKQEGSNVDTFTEWTSVADSMNVKYDLAFMNYPNLVISRKIKAFLNGDKPMPDCEINV